MGRFVFDMIVGGEVTRAEVDLGDERDARKEGMRCIGEYLKDLGDPALSDGFSLEVRDARGHQVMKLAFAALSRHSVQAWTLA